MDRKNRYELLNSYQQGDKIDRRTIIDLEGYPVNEDDYGLKLLKVRGEVKNFLEWKFEKHIYVIQHKKELRILTDSEALVYVQRFSLDGSEKRLQEAHRNLLTLDKSEFTPEQKEEWKLALTHLVNTLPSFKTYRVKRDKIKEKFKPKTSRAPRMPDFWDNSLEEALHNN